MSTDKPPTTKSACQLPRTMQASAPCRITSTELLGDRAEIIIEHEKREYRLRVTQNGKLILTA